MVLWEQSHSLLVTWYVELQLPFNKEGGRVFRAHRKLVCCTILLFPVLKWSAQPAYTQEKRCGLFGVEVRGGGGGWGEGTLSCPGLRKAAWPWGGTTSSSQGVLGLLVPHGGQVIPSSSPRFRAHTGFFYTQEEESCRLIGITEFPLYDL